MRNSIGLVSDAQSSLHTTNVPVKKEKNNDLSMFRRFCEMSN